MTALSAFSPTLYYGALVVFCLALHWTHLALGLYDPGGPTGWRTLALRCETAVVCFFWLGWLVSWFV